MVRFMLFLLLIIKFVHTKIVYLKEDNKAMYFLTNRRDNPLYYSIDLICFES